MRCQPTSSTCVVWSWHLKDSPRQERFLCARVFPGFPTRIFYHLWSRLLRLLSRQQSPPRAFWALLVAFLLSHWLFGLPLRGKCFHCGLKGHLSRNCPQRVGYRARDDAEKDVPDSTAAEAVARASGAPQTESDVDLRDNQPNELSQSILAPVLAPPPPPWVRNSLPIMYL